MADYDVLILGGGVTGAGILRDCSLRGLKACLVEKGELGKGTTANSSHMIHGGLRYLIYDRFETHLTSWDSGHILRTAGPLLKRIPIVWPVYKGHKYGMTLVETLLESYDHFQEMKGGREHLRLSPKEVSDIFPGIRMEGLRGGLSFDEWWVDPVSLVRANTESARKNRAEALVYSEAVELARDGARVIGARIRHAGGREETVSARITVNATGPWADKTAAMAGCRVPLRLRQGTHLVYEDLPLKAGLLVEAEGKDRYVFCLPFGPMTLVGPTDIPCPTDPDTLKPRPEEIAYLIASMKRYLPDFPERYDRTLCGARPILAQASDEKLLSRDYEIFDHEVREGVPGFVSISGGKMAAYRKMSQDLTDLVCAKLGRKAECRTFRETLWGEPVEDIPDHRPPDPRFKAYLSRHPYQRELYALAFLGMQFARHCARLLLGGNPRPDFFHYYGMK